MSQLDQVIDDYLQRRARGENVSAEGLMREHADLMPELGEMLRRVELMDRARRSAQTHDTQAQEPGHAASTAESLQVRCPHCQQINQPDDVAEIIHCAHCQQRFRLLDSDTGWDLPGTLGRFELQCCVGMGGFGSVWKAVDRQLDRVVAIKRPRQSRLHPARLEDFLREARVAAKLKHPHIVDVYEIGREGDDVFIVSDFIDGQSLDDWKNQHRLSPLETTVLVEKVARAVQHAHDCGVIHRDLKPGNILIDQHGEPHITDFGLAKAEADDVTITLDGRILGTPAYMSPEQAEGLSSAVDARSDVYSLGVILFELLTGELPFRGQAAMLVYQVIHDEPPKPRKLNAFVPSDLETVVLKCLEKVSASRYASAGELADELRRIQNGEPVLAQPISSARRLMRWCRRNPSVAAFAGSTVLLLVVLVLTGWWAYFDERQDRQEILAAMEQEDMMRQAFLQTEDFRLFRRKLEETAGDPIFLNEIQSAWQDPQLTQLRQALTDTDLEPARRDELTQQLTGHPARLRLQSWLSNHAREAGIQVFSWFVQDPSGLQIARQPPDRAFGRNYAWRTYFHGGARDYRNYAEYLAEAPRHERHIETTYLSRALFTEVTHRHVVVVSTPIQADGQFLGVLGLMVELDIVR